MATLEEIQLLVKNIATLSSSLPPSFPKASSKDKIWTVMHSPECETPFETFNTRFDALFAEDCRNLEGRLRRDPSRKKWDGFSVLVPEENRLVHIPAGPRQDQA